VLDERGRLALLKRFYEPVCFIPNVLAFCLSKAGKKAIIYTYIYINVKGEEGRRNTHHSSSANPRFGPPRYMAWQQTMMRWLHSEMDEGQCSDMSNNLVYL